MSVTAPSEVPNEDGDNDEGFRLVGKFLHRFALMEQSLDAGIGKLLGLNHGVQDIVCSSIPFAKKLDVFFSAEVVLAELPDDSRSDLLKRVRSTVFELNNERVMFAHSPFSFSTAQGLTFRRVKADGKLKVENKTRSATQVNENCRRAVEMATEMDRIVTEMTPYVPKLDFRDPRNLHLGLLLGLL